MYKLLLQLSPRFGWWQEFIDWLTGWLDAIRLALDPVNGVVLAAAWVASNLPDPWIDPVVASQVGTAVNAVAGYVSLLDYFINLPFLMVVLGVMLAVESGLLFVRAWRLIRSFLT